MASSTDGRNKLVTGYPAPPGHVAIGYPHAAAPPPSAFYTVAYHHQFHTHVRHSLLCHLIAALLTVILIIGAIFSIVWLVLRPRLPEFTVASATVSPINATASEVTATWDVSLLIKNPNTKLTVFYDSLDASVFYGDSLLTQTELRPFSQPKNKQNLIRSRFALVRANVGDNVAKAISSDRARGSVSFGVRVLSLVRFRTGGWRMRKHLLRVYCDGLNIGYSSSNGRGTLLNPSKECEVDI
ncbi:NDR1/HIN1-like protein 10 [Cornus florida]|uniref:NDR1/HIN1-like protein 10 n=1 Tax=Cornus florida TaxID=4283 RepID=UPI0028981FFA|nr:NDR1/HIN1-like protein 10 [Cornus florida]